jgi:hypothetical protein
MAPHPADGRALGASGAKSIFVRILVLFGSVVVVGSEGISGSAAPRTARIKRRMMKESFIFESRLALKMVNRSVR